jgi:hypothetical protein
MYFYCYFLFYAYASLYVSVFILCLCIYYMFMYLHRASWHSSATLTEIFPCLFLSCKANARLKPAKMGHGQHSSKIFVSFCVFLLILSMLHYKVTVYALRNLSFSFTFTFNNNKTIAGNFLTSCKPVSFSRRTLLHGVSK